MSAREADPLLRRLERRALAFCAVASALALVGRPGQPDVALGIVGGGVLIGVSYWAIRSSIDGLVAVAVGRRMTPPTDAPEAGVTQAGQDAPELDAPAGRGRRAIGYMFRFVGRYVVLGALAYLMLVWFRLHPVGLVIGVSSIVVAAVLEVVLGAGREHRS